MAEPGLMAGLNFKANWIATDEVADCSNLEQRYQPDKRTKNYYSASLNAESTLSLVLLLVLLDQKCSI